MPGLVPNVDPEGLLEYSVVYTDRARNHMSEGFRDVMTDVSAALRRVYGADAVAIVGTPQSEYSPTPVPGRDAISVVRDYGELKQQLWSFPLDGGEPQLLLPDVNPVSPRHEEAVSPRDYLEQVSAWYFGHAT